jgi:predicted transcriptional regulator
MAVKTQVVLDDETRALLEELARPRGGNRSFVVREALRVYAAMEDNLDAIERTPAFQRAMAASDADIQHGRVRSHAEAKAVVARKRK